MGTKGREILDLNVDELIELLNKALADEWLAYYQYWIGAKVVKGIMKEAVMAELIQHSADELRHAGMIADRILQLGGTPILTPDDWQKLTNCGYDIPVDFKEIPILKQNIKGEQCAIMTYNKLLHLVKDKDIISFNMISTILADEIEHEDDLETLLEDIES